MTKDYDFIAYDTIMECIDSLSSDEAINIIIAIEQRFGFVGTTFTRADAEMEWRNQTDSTGATEMPDKVWEAVQQSWAWRKGIAEITTERGWDLVYEAVREAINED